jgi:arsenate reductase
MDTGSQTLRVIADPTRARILARMLESADGRVLVGRIADELGLTQPTVSHHMKALVDEGILRREPVGRQAWYSIQPEQLDRVADLLSTSSGGKVSDAVLGRISRDLATRFAGSVDAATVARVVKDSYERLLVSGASTRHLPSRTSRFSAERLSALSRQELADHRGTPEVLFVCVQNAGRSQIAAAILRQLAGERVRVRTAGSAPTGEVRATIVNALDEIGVPIGHEYPKPLTDEAVRAADLVITMGCGDVCPVYPGRRYLDWDLEDPVGLPLARVREIRDDIEGRVRSLLDSLNDNVAGLTDL